MSGYTRSRPMKSSSSSSAVPISFMEASRQLSTRSRSANNLELKPRLNEFQSLIPFTVVILPLSLA